MCRHPNLGFWSQYHLLIKRKRHPNQKAETTSLEVKCPLADQKVETTPDPPGESWKVVFEASVTCWSKGRDILIKRQSTLIKRQRHPNLGFWSQCHLLIWRWRHPDQREETPLIKRCRHPNLGFLKSVSLADQKAETTPLEVKCHLLIKRWRQCLTPQWKLEIRFLKLVSLADQKAETS